MKNIASFGFRLLGIYHKLASISLFCLKVVYIKSATWCKGGVSSASMCEQAPKTPKTHPGGQWMLEVNRTARS